MSRKFIIFSRDGSWTRCFLWTSIVLLTGTTVLFAQSGQGRVKISSGIGKYYNSEFEEAIKELNEALMDLSLDFKDSTIAFFYIAFSHLKIGEETKGRGFFQKILMRNPDEELLKGFEEFQEVFEKVRKEVKSRLLCQVTINTIPSEAAVYLDGVFQGKTPITLPGLTKNKFYSLKIERANYESLSMRLIFHRDTSFIFVLTEIRPSRSQDTVLPRIQDRYIYSRPRTFAYLLGAGIGAVLGLTAGGISWHWDNQAQKKLHEYALEQDTAKERQLVAQIHQYDLLRTVFYYSSYPLTALGFYIGLKIAERVPGWYAQNYKEKDRLMVYGSIDQDLNPGINIRIRRDLW